MNVNTDFEKPTFCTNKFVENAKKIKNIFLTEA